MRLPSIGTPAAWFKRLSTWRYNGVHPMPDLLWRSTSTSSEDSDGNVKADLVGAAMFLLENAALAGPTKPSEHQPIGALAAKDWTAFVRKCTAAKPRAVASSRLLAMRNAVPSPSARMVFQSQVGPKFSQNWWLSVLQLHSCLQRPNKADLLLRHVSAPTCKCLPFKHQPVACT